MEIPGALSLKEKRSIMLNLKERIRNKFNVSVSETDNHDKWQRATIGVACVSKDRAHADSMLNKVVREVENSRSARLLDFQLEIL